MKKINQKGFTIMELLVSFTVVAMVSTIVVAKNYKYSGRQSRLDIALQKVISDLRLIQDYSLGLKEFNASLPDGGWGIYFQPDTNQYIIFAEETLDDVYSGVSELYKTVNLPEDIRIRAGNFDGTDNGGSPFFDRTNLYVIFEPPDPRTHINTRGGGGDIDDAQEVVIEFEFEGTTFTKSITINSMGLIEYN